MHCSQGHDLQRLDSATVIPRRPLFIFNLSNEERRKNELGMVGTRSCGCTDSRVEQLLSGTDFFLNAHAEKETI